MHCCLVKSATKVITNLDLIQIKIKLERNMKKRAKICRFTAIHTQALTKKHQPKLNQ
jgi:hypothetical protein